MSAPVVDVTKADSTSWKEKYLGIVDVVRLVVVMQEALFREDSGIPEEDEAALAAPDTKAPLHFHPLTSRFLLKWEKKKKENIFLTLS